MHLLLFAAPSLAAPAPPPPPEPPAMVAFDDEPPPPPDEDEAEAAGFFAMADQLGLTEDQRAKVRDVFYANHTERIDIGARKKKSLLDVKRALAAEKFDEKVVTRSAEALAGAEGDLVRNRLKLAIELRKLLTAEQWSKLEEARESRRGERRGRR
jgi:Spy/CpxP family protein refolding chaperone